MDVNPEAPGLIISSLMREYNRENDGPGASLYKLQRLYKHYSIPENNPVKIAQFAYNTSSKNEQTSKQLDELRETLKIFWENIVEDCRKNSVVFVQLSQIYLIAEARKYVDLVGPLEIAYRKNNIDQHGTEKCHQESNNSFDWLANKLKINRKVGSIIEALESPIE